MPKPTCIQCESEESLLWRPVEGGQICNDCHMNDNASKDIPKTPTKNESNGEKDDKGTEGDGDSKQDVTPAKATGKGTRKSTRATRYKTKTPATASKTTAPRGRGRRSLFKRTPIKAPTSTPTVVTGDSIFYKGNYMQVGDIVSMLDVDGGTYYAQIRGFLTDQYCEKSAVITWLLPTKASPPPEMSFDPSTYIIGPDEDLPRKLEVMEFIMHAPSDYYKADNAPYPPMDTQLKSRAGFIWSCMETKDRF